MKKLFVILLAALLLVSFTSCNQDKIDELEKKVAEKETENETLKAEKEDIVKNYEDFVDAYSFYNRFSPSFSLVIRPDSDNKVDVDFSTSSSLKPGIISILEYLALTEDEKLNSNTLTETKGTISGTGKMDSTTNEQTEAALKFTGNSFKVKYTTNKTSEAKEFTLTLDGDYSFKNGTDKSEVTFKMTVNGTAYDISFEKDSKTGEFTAAKANGKDVNIGLLNNQISYGAM